MRWRWAPAVAALQAGEVIAYPTEGVWGFGCDPWNPQAVGRVLRLKQRPWQKGLILVACSCEQIEPLLRSLTREQRAQLESSWPGPNTWVIEDPEQWVPAWVRGEHSSVAVRVSAHPVVAALCEAFGGPLVSTSANRAGCPPMRYDWQVRYQFADQLGAVVPGPLGGQRGPSRIRELISGRELRPA
ncbi:L-threonylcarbamoyladenylate synthase [Aestuariirhabdus litorea]|uniref:Threonylcarbamoyl-AMP synthase n=1 Tax=Aestuariirhabdus litorea TaxID=2528527 RepID=A0A3P3VJS4_9GAMM|nr:Sua5/YciO/YrdC/YwlC family protein [Aestuariirhabdus litorea]RRJ82577.1 tRNA threonylcarbamoyladenosine biosynthesis protein RimN [Aestuariirhabdus litorea]RWW92735.1 tRNA threonylcarbamoyladenosine biosynthesis protein RimN [Endozoicomonadaceae bacterium GTF-13]